MPEAGLLPIPEKLLRRGVRDMVRISDCRMSGTASGTIVLHVAPEAAVGGPISLVRDGDEVELDVGERRIDLLVPDSELERRAREPEAGAGTSTGYGHVGNGYAGRGYVRLYREHVMQADAGCDFDFLRDA